MWYGGVGGVGTRCRAQWGAMVHERGQFDLRIILFAPYQITNEELWKRMKQPKIDLQIRKRKWGWLSHTQRKLSDDIARQALEWNPKSKRGRGRPRNTW